MTIDPITMTAAITQASDITTPTETATTGLSENSVGLPTSLNDEVSFLNATGAAANTAATTDQTPSLVQTGEAPLGLTPPIDPYTQAVASGAVPTSAIYQQQNQGGFSLSLSSPWVKYGVVVLLVGAAMVVLYLKRGLLVELISKTVDEVDKET